MAIQSQDAVTQKVDGKLLTWACYDSLDGWQIKGKNFDHYCCDKEKQCQGQLLTVLVIWGICLTAEGILNPTERKVSKCKNILVDLFILWWIILKQSNTGQRGGVSDCLSVCWRGVNWFREYNCTKTVWIIFWGLRNPEIFQHVNHCVTAISTIVIKTPNEEMCFGRTTFVPAKR